MAKFDWCTNHADCIVVYSRNTCPLCDEIQFSKDIEAELEAEVHNLTNTVDSQAREIEGLQSEITAMEAGQ